MCRLESDRHPNSVRSLRRFPFFRAASRYKMRNATFDVASLFKQKSKGGKKLQPRNGGIPDGKEREREREGAINTDVKPRTDRGLSSCRESFSNFATRAAQNIYMYDAFLRSAGIVRNVDRRIKLPTLRAKNECASSNARVENFYVSIIY